MPKYFFHKLVRDKLPDIFMQRNQKATVRTLGNNDHWRELKRKFIEEASELPNDLQDKVAIMNELGDLLRIVKDSAVIAGVDFTAIERADEEKTAKSGGFLQGMYVDTMEVTDDDPWNEYYRGEPGRFPEIRDAANVKEIIDLSEELAELGKIDRRTLLPGGRHESDSHHSFSLALIAYDICQKYCPELDINLVLRYALVHDLLEIITGDEDTLLSSASELRAKHRREQAAWKDLEARLKVYPALLNDLRAYEMLDTPEAATVYILDKSCTIWTHFWDEGKSLRSRGPKTRAEIDMWHDTQMHKLHARLKTMPPQIILDIFSESHTKMREELFAA